MACYHFSLKQVSRGKGASVISKAAYHAGAKLQDFYYGKVANYTNKRGVVFEEIMLPAHAPERFLDRETLWNEVEKIETNKKAQLANNFEIALMNEFTLEENIALAKKFVQEQLVSRGMIADVAIHDPPRKPGEEPNPHIHVMCPIRPLNEDGTWGIKQKKEIVVDKNGQPVLGKNGKPKERAYSVTGWNSKESLVEYRKAWADMVNALYEEKELSIRVDYRSLEEQGIERLPTVHEGPNVRAMEKKGIRTAIGDLNRMIRQVNQMIRKVRFLFAWTEAKKLDLEMKINVTKNALKEPTLANYLQNYYSKRNRNAESYRYGTQKAKNTNLKQYAEIIAFLEKEDIKTPTDLKNRIQSLSNRFNQAQGEIQELLALNKDYKERLRAWECYQKTRPIYEEYCKKRFGKERFKKEHQKELNTYHWAHRYLQDYKNENGKINTFAWEKAADHALSEVEKMKSKKEEMRTELQMLRKIKGCIEEIEKEESVIYNPVIQSQVDNKNVQAEEPRKEPVVPKRKPKTHSHEMEL